MQKEQDYVTDNFGKLPVFHLKVIDYTQVLKLEHLKNILKNNHTLKCPHRNIKSTITLVILSDKPQTS